jgi:hypothetical protein
LISKPPVTGEHPAAASEPSVELEPDDNPPLSEGPAADTPLPLELPVPDGLFPDELDAPEEPPPEEVPFEGEPPADEPPTVPEEPPLPWAGLPVSPGFDEVHAPDAPNPAPTQPTREKTAKRGLRLDRGDDAIRELLVGSVSAANAASLFKWIYWIRQ